MNRTVSDAGDQCETRLVIADNFVKVSESVKASNRQVDERWADRINRNALQLYSSCLQPSDERTSLKAAKAIIQLSSTANLNDDLENLNIIKDALDSLETIAFNAYDDPNICLSVLENYLKASKSQKDERLIDDIHSSALKAYSSCFVRKYDNDPKKENLRLEAAAAILEVCWGKNGLSEKKKRMRSKRLRSEKIEKIYSECGEAVDTLERLSRFGSNDNVKRTASEKLSNLKQQ